MPESPVTPETVERLRVFVERVADHAPEQWADEARIVLVANEIASAALPPSPPTREEWEAECRRLGVIQRYPAPPSPPERLCGVGEYGDDCDNPALSGDHLCLISAAEMTAWNEELRWMLTEAVEARGMRVGTYDHCGDLVDALRLAGEQGEEKR